MTRASLRALVEDLTSAAQAVEKWHEQQDGLRVLTSARRAASSSAAIVARLQGFEDEEIAGWTAAVDRAARHKDERDEG